MARRWWGFLLLLAQSQPALAQRPPAQIPDSPDVVVERLPRGYGALRPRPARVGVSPIVEAELLLQAAGRTGDTRLATRADALLATVPPRQMSPRALKSLAFSAQYRHDFAGSLELLDRVIRAEPRDPDARLARAQLQLVQGRIDAARADCAALSFAIDGNYGTACIAALSLRTGDLDRAAAFADRWLAQAKTDRSFRRFMLVMRGEIASRAADPDADSWFQQALALAPEDVRTLAAYARHLNQSGRPRAVLTLLSRKSETDTLRLQRALAAHSLRTPDAAALAEDLARRYALARTVGVQPELRDEAELLLTLRGQPARALQLAQRNFESQRDHEDVDLLVRAARAAGRPAALAAMEKWAAEQHITLDRAKSSR